MDANGSMDASSSHAGCPVTEGVKWVATLWIHSKPFTTTETILNKKLQPEFHDPAECHDLKKSNCEARVRAGQCKTKPDYMVGTGQPSVGAVGRCRQACGACEVCQDGDSACRVRNRERVGFVTIVEAWDAIEFGRFPWSQTSADNCKSTFKLILAIPILVFCFL